jgi:hypothetical protein
LKLHSGQGSCREEEGGSGKYHDSLAKATSGIKAVEHFTSSALMGWRDICDQPMTNTIFHDWIKVREYLLNQIR